MNTVVLHCSVLTFGPLLIAKESLVWPHPFPRLWKWVWPCKTSEDTHFPLPKNAHKEMAIKLSSGIIPETLMEGMLHNTKSIK